MKHADSIWFKHVLIFQPWLRSGQEGGGEQGAAWERVGLLDGEVDVGRATAGLVREEAVDSQRLVDAAGHVAGARHVAHLEPQQVHQSFGS